MCRMCCLSRPQKVVARPPPYGAEGALPGGACCQDHTILLLGRSLLLSLVSNCEGLQEGVKKLGLSMPKNYKESTLTHFAILCSSSSWLGFGMCLIVCPGYGNRVLEILVQSRWLWERRLLAWLLVFLSDMESLLWTCLLLIYEKLLWASMVRTLKLTLHLADQVHKCALLFLCAI